MHRLLVMNIDGTVLQSNGKLDKSIKEAVEYVQNKGVRVTLATGRNFNFAKRVAKALKIDSLLIAHHGASIASSIDQAIFIKRIDENIIHGLLQFIESFPCKIQAINEQYSIHNKPKENQKIIGRIVVETADLTTYQQQFTESVSEYIQSEQILPTHIEVNFESNTDADDVTKALKGMYYEIDVFQYGRNLVILPTGISKLKGLLYLADYWGIPLNETVAIGSNIDDLEVVSAVGLGVAMGNAPIELKAKADWITRSNNDQGVSYMIREHFRKQQPFEFLEKLQTLKKM